MRISVLQPQPERERHADAEEESADDVRQPGEARRRCRSTSRGRSDRRAAARCAEDRHRDRKQPHAHAVPVAHVDDVGHRAHGAEVRLVADRAEDKGEREGAPDDGAGAALRVRENSLAASFFARASAPRHLRESRCLACSAAGDEGYFFISARRVSRAARSSPSSAWELAMLSRASGALALSGQVLTTFCCAAIADLVVAHGVVGVADPVLRRRQRAGCSGNWP